MAAAKGKDMPSAFLTEMKAIVVTETRKAFVRDMLEQASELNERVLEQDVGAAVNAEVVAAMGAMRRWQEAKIRMMEREVGRRKREEERLDLKGKTTQQSLEREVSWLMDRIEELGKIERCFIEKKSHYEQLKRDYIAKCQRLKGFLRYVTRENMQMYPQILTKPASSPLLKRTSATPEPIPTSTSRFMSNTQQRAVSVLKVNLLKTQRSLSTLKQAAKEKRSISPISALAETEKFFQNSLQRLAPKSFQATERLPGPLLRSRTFAKPRFHQPKQPYKSLDEFKSMPSADVLDLLVSNQLAQRHLLYATFHSAVYRKDV
jgi:hypothetical protein